MRELLLLATVILVAGGCGPAESDGGAGPGGGDTDNLGGPCLAACSKLRECGCSTGCPVAEEGGCVDFQLEDCVDRCNQAREAFDARTTSVCYIDWVPEVEHQDCDQILGGSGLAGEEACNYASPPVEC